MNNEQKQQVRAALLRYAATFAGRAQAAESLNGVEPALITQLLQGNYEMIADQVWRNIARQVGFYEGGWVPAETSVFQLLRLLLDDAREFATVYSVAITEGSGKTFTALQYMSEQTGCCYMPAEPGHNMRTFTAGLLQAAGTRAAGTLPAMQQQLCSHLAHVNCRLLVVDNVHLLKDRVLHLLLQTAGLLAGRCGIVLMGNTALAVRLQQGISKGEPACTAFFQLTGRRLISLGSINLRDVELVCHANGLDIPDLVARVKQESRGDMHKAQQLIRQFCGMGIAA